MAGEKQEQFQKAASQGKEDLQSFLSWAWLSGE